MKRLSIMFALVLILALMAGRALAVKYCKDYLENANPGGWTRSLKTFEEEITLEGSDTVLVDIWINDLRPDVLGGPDSLISAGFEASWSSNLTVVNVTPYDTANGGPWDSQMSKIESPGANILSVCLGSMGCVQQDRGGDIILARLEIHYLGQGTGTITFTPIAGGFDTNVSCMDMHNYDSEISPSTFTIGKSTTQTTTTTTPPGTTTITSTISITSTTSTIIPTPTTSTSSSTTTAISSLWSLAYNEMWGSRKDKKLSLLRAFRDEVLTDNEVGRDYLFMLYNNSLEVLTLLIRNPLLTEETKEVIDELLPGIQSALDGGEMILSKKQLADVESLFTEFETRANPGLKTVIKNLRKEVREGKVFKTE